MRLIDADNVDYENIMCSQMQLHWLFGIIEEQPTVDAVQVVRCKDCFYNNNGSCEMSEQCTDNYRPDYYCADGLRKDEGE